MSILKIKDREDIVKDTKSGAILLNQRSVANEYLNKKKVLSNDRVMSEEINTLKEKVAMIDDLKKDMSDIKELLQRIANK
jgi:hypothetical protein